MNQRKRSFQVVLCLLFSQGASYAHTQPSPVEFLAGITAFSELCAQRFSNMKDAPVKLAQSFSPDEKVLFEEAMHSPEYSDALARARIKIHDLSVEKVETECKAMNEGFK